MNNRYLFTIETLCSPNPCANDGTCKVSGDHFTCGCTKHYVGKYCEGKRRACGQK